MLACVIHGEELRSQIRRLGHTVQDNGAATSQGGANRSPRTAVTDVMLAKNRKSENTVRLHRCWGYLTKNMPVLESVPLTRGCLNPPQKSKGKTRERPGPRPEATRHQDRPTRATNRHNRKTETSQGRPDNDSAGARTRSPRSAGNKFTFPFLIVPVLGSAPYARCLGRRPGAVRWTLRLSSPKWNLTSLQVVKGVPLLSPKMVF